MILPYVTLIGGGTTTSYIVGKKSAKDGKFNYGASSSVALGFTASSVVANTIIEANYQDAIERHKAETTSAYVQQLSDEELEVALMKFDLLEQEDKNDVKVL